MSEGFPPMETLDHETLVGDVDREG